MRVHMYADIDVCVFFFYTYPYTGLDLTDFMRKLCSGGTSGAAPTFTFGAAAAGVKSVCLMCIQYVIHTTYLYIYIYNVDG